MQDRRQNHNARDGQRCGTGDHKLQPGRETSKEGHGGRLDHKSGSGAGEVGIGGEGAHRERYGRNRNS